MKKKIFNLKMVINKKNILFFFFFLYFILINNISYAQDTISPTKKINFDNSQLSPRSFNKSKLEDFRSNSQYQYGENGPIKTNLFDRILNWIFRNLLKRISNPRINKITEYIILTICALIVIYALLKLTKSDWLNVFLTKSKKTKNLNFEELDENIHELDFEKLIALSIKEGNYTRAVRLSYLKILKSMSDKQLIDWRLNKTNHDYLVEISKSSFEPEFKQLTFIFEYICYGSFPIKQNDYQSIAETFKGFEQKIKSS